MDCHLSKRKAPGGEAVHPLPSPTHLCKIGVSPLPRNNNGGAVRRSGLGPAHGAGSGGGLGAIAEDGPEEEDEEEAEEEEEAPGGWPRAGAAAGGLVCDIDDVPQAFSHFTFDVTCGQKLVCDLQVGAGVVSCPARAHSVLSWVWPRVLVLCVQPVSGCGRGLLPRTCAFSWVWRMASCLVPRYCVFMLMRWGWGWGWRGSLARRAWP